MSFAFLAITFNFIGWLAAPENILQIVGGWFMLIWFGGSLALFLGTLSESLELVEKIWHPMSYLLFPLSGAAFMVDALPQYAQHLILFLPMVHAVEYIREGYFGSQIHAHYDMSYMAVCNAVLTLLGLALAARVSRHIVPA